METVQFRTVESLRADILQKASNDPDFRSRLLAAPAAALEGEYGFAMPDGFSVEVHEETPMRYHLVLSSTEELSVEELEAIAAGAHEGTSTHNSGNLDSG